MNAAPQDTLPDSFQGDRCRSCNEVLQNAVTTEPGASSPQQCVCGPRYFRANDSCALCVKGMVCEEPDTDISEVGTSTP
jgi:hypothetical protein